ncbi:MAG: hypothetical protein ICV68_14800 [Pyrinomonadaceae bacterium]|nr:hypothetical protein [Pyrinomonadaceae bacterium]
MEAGVFLLQSDNTLVRMNEQAYQAESLLQQLLAEHPDLLAGDQINPSVPRRWLLIGREAGVPAVADGADWWSVDHLFLDQDAIPTFVEVKRAVDTRARREVVAQMLDYAANATENWPTDRMREQLARRSADVGTDPTTDLREVIGADGDEEEFWNLAKSNLREGRVRLLFVADRIPASLRRIVEFLNRQMNPAEVLAIEIRQFASGGDGAIRTLVPRVIGQTEEARDAKSAPRSPSRTASISSDEFVERLPGEHRDLALAIVQMAEAAGFTANDYTQSATNVSVHITPRGVPGRPITLDRDYLWVSLGRYRDQAALRGSTVNREIREAILLVSPSCKQAKDLKKSQVGIRLSEIAPDGVAQLPMLFDLLSRSLLQAA